MLRSSPLRATGARDRAHPSGRTTCPTHAPVGSRAQRQSPPAELSSRHRHRIAAQRRAPRAFEISARSSVRLSLSQEWPIARTRERCPAWSSWQWDHPIDRRRAGLLLRVEANALDHLLSISLSCSWNTATTAKFRVATATACSILF